MSRANDIAQGMVAHLNTEPGFDGVEALVDRQLDVDTEIRKRVFLARGQSRGKGAMMTVFYSGFQNPDAYAARVPNVTRNYLVTIYAAPVLKSGNVPADDIMELAAQTMHNWEPDDEHGIAEIHVLNGVARPDAEFLIYDLEVQVKGKL